MTATPKKKNPLALQNQSIIKSKNASRSG